MTDMENSGIRENKGYLVIEQTEEDMLQVIYADNKACALTGLTMADLLNANPIEVINGLESVPVTLDDRHEIWILDSASNRQQRMAELEKMNMMLEDALKAAEAANEAKSNFLSNMSHDIRTPMNAIVGMTSIGLSHIDEKARVQDCLQKIQSASTHLMSLVNDVLDMSRIDSGRITLNVEEFSLADMLHDISIIIRPQAAQKNQNFQIEIGRIYEENLCGDPLRLRQILVNIIGNAIKYTQAEGDIQVSISQHLENTDTLGEKKSDIVWLDFQCKDNGLGMSKEFLTRIFIPFERVSNTTISKIEGTGLGMAIVKNILDRMGGQIKIESEEGKGSCFDVSIPMRISPQNTKSLNLPEGQNILIVESNDNRAKHIISFLQEGGFIPIQMENGLDAVTWLTEAQYECHMPCAMILGQELSDIPVLEMAAHIRQLAGQDFPILLVSEGDWAQIEYRATRAGINAFVPCPLFKSRLFATLSNLIGNVQRDQDSHANQIDYSNYRVLLVEDNELNREIAIELLSLIGVQVEEAENGARAVEIFESSPEGYFDLVFMDVQMPVMNGYEATKKIRQMPRQDAKDIWIVAMTANAFVEDIRMSKDAGMNEHLSKPVDVERLQEIIRTRLKA